MSQQDLPCTPPQKKLPKEVNFFRIGVLIPPKFFPKEKGDYVGDMRTRTPRNVVFRHNRSNPISTRLTLFGNIEYNDRSIILKVSLS